MSIMIEKRNGNKELLDITKIQDMTSDSTRGIEFVSQSELELDSQIKFVDGMKSSDIQKELISTAVEKIDFDCPGWTYVGARLFIYDMYHNVGRNTGGTKGRKYSSMSHYIKTGIERGRLFVGLADGFDMKVINNAVVPERDELFTYLGIKTLHDRYLIKDSEGKLIELPQQMFMGISMFLAQNYPLFGEMNRTNMAVKFYNVISTHEAMLATPTLSNARTNKHQLSSCYIGSTPDNIEGIFDSYYEMALLSKYGGGIGWDFSNIRGLGSVIDDYRDVAGGIVPFLKIANDVALAVDQLGTRKGAIAVYIEPWHNEVIDFIDLKKNSGEERRRAHDLFPALWLNDIFMERIKVDGDWTLFDPYECKELSELHGEEFKARYEELERDDTLNKTVIKAKNLWKHILTSLFESGSPFLTFKDEANRRNPNRHKGHIRSSNLCVKGDTKVKIRLNRSDVSELEIEIKDMQYYLNTYYVETLSMNLETGENEWKEVSNFAMTNPKAKTLKVKYKDKEIICTPEHKIYTSNRGYVKAIDLKKDDILIIK